MSTSYQDAVGRLLAQIAEARAARKDVPEAFDQLLEDVRTLAPDILCPDCRGTAITCRTCNLTGLVCPECKAARWVRSLRALGPETLAGAYGGARLPEGVEGPVDRRRTLIAADDPYWREPLKTTTPQLVPCHICMVPTSDGPVYDRRAEEHAIQARLAAIAWAIPS